MQQHTSMQHPSARQSSTMQLQNRWHQQPVACCAMPTASPLLNAENVGRRARTYYDTVWSHGKVLMLDEIMAENHEQQDKVWQPNRVMVGRKAMKRGILAYRAAYPDLQFKVQLVAPVLQSGGDAAASCFVHWHAQGTNLGHIKDRAPSGKQVSFSGITRLDFDASGRICRSLVFRQASEDEAAHFLSAGVIPGTSDASQQPSS